MDESRLESVTNEVYRETASHYGCNWSDVERNLRTSVDRAWRINSAYLIKLAGYPMDGPPTASEFVTVISDHIIRTYRLEML